jgi:hypothetical protein
MADDKASAQTPSAATAKEEPVPTLEEALASLGATQITHKHDGLSAFRRWHEAYRKKNPLKEPPAAPAPAQPAAPAAAP